MKNTGMVRKEAEDEVDRYCVLPGQACAYKVHNTEDRALCSCSKHLKFKLNVLYLPKKERNTREFSFVDFSFMLRYRVSQKKCLIGDRVNNRKPVLYRVLGC